MTKPEPVHLVITHRHGRPIADFNAEVDLEDDGNLQALLAEAVDADGWPADRLNEFEMAVRDPTTDRLIKTIRAKSEDL